MGKNASYAAPVIAPVCSVIPDYGASSQVPQADLKMGVWPSHLTKLPSKSRNIKTSLMHSCQVFGAYIPLGYNGINEVPAFLHNHYYLYHNVSVSVHAKIVSSYFYSLLKCPRS